MIIDSFCEKKVTTEYQSLCPKYRRQIYTNKTRLSRGNV